MNDYMVKIATPSDFKFIYNLYMHPLVNPYLLYEQMSETEFQPIFDDLIGRKLIYIFQENGQNIAMFKFVPMPFRNTHIAYLGGVGVHPDFSGKGYGKKLMQAVIDLAKAQGLRRIELSTATTNERAIRLYESVGFEKEGVLRQYTYLKSEDRYLDEVMMALLL
jgi:L-phenylalanine/L-methionine N-acetyltransferase